MTYEVHDSKIIPEWLVSLKILHRGHWDAARWFEQLNLWLGVATAILATVAGTSAFAGSDTPFVTGAAGLIAAVLAAVQTALRASELSAKHKHAGIRFGQLRRELEEQLVLGLDQQGPDQEKAWLTGFRERWASVDDESLPVPRRYFERAKRTVHQPR